MVSIRFAVRESPVLAQSAMSPAPTSTLGATALTTSVSAPEPPSSFATLTPTLYVPAAPSLCVAVFGVAGDVAVPVLELPSPQPTVYAHGASPGSPSLKVAA